MIVAHIVCSNSTRASDICLLVGSAKRSLRDTISSNIGARNARTFASWNCDGSVSSISVLNSSGFTPFRTASSSSISCPSSRYSTAMHDTMALKYRPKDALSPSNSIPPTTPAAAVPTVPPTMPPARPKMVPTPGDTAVPAAAPTLAAAIPAAVAPAIPPATEVARHAMFWAYWAPLALPWKSL